MVEKIHADPRRAEKERSAYMRMEPIEWWYKCIDIAFPEQVNVKAHTNITKAGKSAFINDIVTDHPEQINQWFCRLHSHNSMAAQRSGEDQQTRDDFSLQSDGFLSIVTSHKSGNSKCGNIFYTGTFDIYQPIRLEFQCDVVAEEVPEEYKKMMDSIVNEQQKLLAVDIAGIDRDIQTINEAPDSVDKKDQEDHIRMLLNAPTTTSFIWVEGTGRYKANKIDKLNRLKNFVVEQHNKTARVALSNALDVIERDDDVIDLNDYIDDLDTAEETKKVVHKSINWTWNRITREWEQEVEEDDSAGFQPSWDWDAHKKNRSR